jgi:cytochrome P450
MKETDPVTGKGLSAHEMHGRIITVLGAGHETVALTLMWIWYLLSQHPLQEAKLHAEVDQVLGGRAPELKDITKLTYTRAVVEEALRLYPPFHTMAWRAALKDDEVCGVRIPKGATITIAPWVLHRHSMLWNDPDRFDPERFSTERSRERSAYAYLPFGLGQRACVGAQLAMTETTLILATLAQHYRLRLLSGQRVEPQGFVLLKARYGMKMTVESRR